MIWLSPVSVSMRPTLLFLWQSLAMLFAFCFVLHTSSPIGFSKLLVDWFFTLWGELSPPWNTRLLFHVDALTVGFGFLTNSLTTLWCLGGFLVLLEQAPLHHLLLSTAPYRSGPMSPLLLGPRPRRRNCASRSGLTITALAVLWVRALPNPKSITSARSPMSPLLRPHSMPTPCHCWPALLLLLD